MPKGSKTGLPTFSKEGYRMGSCGGCKQMAANIKTHEKQTFVLRWKCKNCGTENVWNPPKKSARTNNEQGEISGWNFGPKEALWTAEEINKDKT